MGAPRFSILLPTRNGGPFLARCIDSVLEQTHRDFELVVADNANDDATQDILGCHSADGRLRVVRSETVLSVTENWAAALGESTGEYVLMIGDDDLLLPDTLTDLESILDRYAQPECVTFNGYRYVAPHSIGNDATSYYDAPYFQYAAELPQDGLLSPTVRRRLVEGLYSFDFSFPLTMQLTLFRRSAVGRLPRGMFRSVFPDHYGMCGLLLTADSWVLVNRPLLVVGVSPKSFGQFFFNDRDGDGLEYLGMPVVVADPLAGNLVLNATCAFLQETLDDFGDQLRGVDIDRGAYVARQLRYWTREYQAGRFSRADIARHLAMLRSRDMLALGRSYGRPRNLFALAHAAVTHRSRRRSDDLIPRLTPLPGVENIAEFAAWVGGDRTCME